jgi:hypothetical protein
MTKLIALACAAFAAACFAAPARAEEWKPAQGRLMTRWAKDVTPDNVLPEYPRPQMVRKEWQNLNGLWDYAIRPKDEGKPQKWDGKILVPFCAESALSGVMKPVGKDNRLWYRRTFTVPESWNEKRVLLHFGAVDWDATVWVNGKQVGNHRGGYDPFTFDLADSVKPGSKSEMIVSVWDPTNAGEQPRGKQLMHPKGIWYTPVTGIWQTVWIEPVPQGYIRAIRIMPDFDRGEVVVRASLEGLPENAVLKAEAFSGGELVSSGGGTGPVLKLRLRSTAPWTPDSPHLYQLKLAALLPNPQEQDNAGRFIVTSDSVESYFAMRKIALRKDDKGIVRMMLNDKPVFQFGPLDQGWWPDGLYTAPTDEALRYDVEITKKLGFNMARKHTKVEPDRWYYWCDKLGLLVWQDMVSGFSTERPFAKWDPIGTHDNTEGSRSSDSRQIYDAELKAMIDALYNHPSIVMWVPFNEGWGQFDTVRVTNWVKEYDPTRLVNAASGGNDFPVGDVKDIHAYPGPAAPKLDGKRAIVLGEFGGLGLPVEGHTWQSKDNWGYRTYQNAEDLAENYRNLYVRLRRLIDEPGLSAAVYTQTTDVEGEVNGLLTYDRAVVKIPEATIREAHAKLAEPPAVITTVIPDARTQAIEWRYTTEKPADGWEKPTFDDSSWKTGPGGFGTPGTPGAVVRTRWDTPDIWIRRSFDLPADAHLASPHLVIHHDENAEVYINGEEATRVRRYTTEYVEQLIAPAAKATLKPGRNVLAAHCKQTGGGQYIDVGIVEIGPGK